MTPAEFQLAAQGSYYAKMTPEGWAVTVIPIMHGKARLTISTVNWMVYDNLW